MEEEEGRGPGMTRCEGGREVGGSGRRQDPGAVASGRAARGQGSGVSVEGGWYAKMAGELARGIRKRKKKWDWPKATVPPSNSLKKFKWICINDGFPQLHKL
jgi:hypothetical protein